MSEATIDPQAVIVDWCNRISRSVSRRDLKDHMLQISEKVRVYGVPGYKQLTFLLKPYVSSTFFTEVTRIENQMRRKTLPVGKRERAV